MALRNSLSEQAFQSLGLEKLERAKQRAAARRTAAAMTEALPPSSALSNESERFIAWAAQHLHIQNKQKQVVPFMLNRVQRDYVLNSTRRDLVVKARQQGLSTVLQGENYYRVATRPSSVMTLGKDDENTQLMRRLFGRFHELHSGGNKPSRRLDNATLSTFPDTLSEVLIAKAGSGSSGRGATLTKIHGSEVAFWKDAESIISGALQAGDPAITLETTANGARGWFYETVLTALGGGNDWRVHFYPWWWSDEYRLPLEQGERIDYSSEESALIAAHGLTDEQIKWRRAKQRELGRLFLQEYPEDVHTCFLLSGFGYFGEMTGVFVAPMHAVPQQGRRYAGGLDWGQSDDYTTLSIMDAETLQEVDVLRVNKMPYADIRHRVVSKIVQWKPDTLIVEKNSASSNAESLYEELHAAEWKGNLIAAPMTNPFKAALTANFYAALYEGGLKLLPDPIWERELRAVVTKQTPTGLWTYEAEQEHDDTYIARILAWHAVANPSVIKPGSVPDALKDFFGFGA